MSVRSTVTDDGIGTILFSHPPLNILTQAVLAELREGLARVSADRSLRVLLLAAEGDHFSAGADIGEHLPPRYQEMIPEFIETIRMVAEFPAPVIAVARGRCLGAGFEIVQAADMIVADETATFGQPEIRLGVVAPAACVLLPARGRHALAAELLFTGDVIDARRALEAGLVCRVVAEGQAMNEAMALANRMARHSAAALRATKRMLRQRENEPLGLRLSGAGKFYVSEVMQTRDAHEGLSAFLEKRKPVWANE